MAGVAAHIKRGAPPPRALELALACKRFGALPFSGGILDQPPLLVDAMTVALATYDAFRVMDERGVDTPPEIAEIAKKALEAMREL